MADPFQAPKNPFAIQKEQVNQRFNAQGQQQDDALKRRFAAMGGLNSGAYIKNQQLQGQEVAQQREGAIANVDAQEAQFGLQAQESQKQRDFQREEGDKGRAFQQQAFDFEKGAKLRQLDMADREFSEDQKSTEFNKMVAALQAGAPFDLRDYLKQVGLTKGVKF
jgi:hypothetical protein